ncbi:hypothetical protein EF910_21190 [Streptomyces sp. WAC07149]|uniref:hypothetical protein n=1 Tax=Streptomyces sp. WAC07149 TaxID=2487425 RepID=UPI000F76D1FC|nr:hypothetical protein [Streptomyces sp. WAC07149]RST03105.1 hypothetical protein EF910_21190 [Streptomyces sp. WAC07149]
MNNCMADWLAASHPNPRQAWTEWTDHGVAVIPVGQTFGAVRIPEAVVHAAVESTDPDDIAFALAERLDGPVIHDGRGRNFYPLLRPEDRLDWRTSARGVECLAPRTHLGVPAVNRCEYTRETPIYWSVPGTEPSHCASASVALLIRVGAARLDEATP